MITYLVSLESSETSYLFNVNKYHKGEDTPRHISVETHLLGIFYKYCMLSDFRQIFKTPGKSISRTDIFTNLVGKNFFPTERFSKTPANALN